MAKRGRPPAIAKPVEPAEVAQVEPIAEPNQQLISKKETPMAKEPVSKAAVPAQPVEPEPVKVEPAVEGKHVMLFNVEHNQVRYEAGKTYLLAAEIVEVFRKNGWI